MSQSFEYDDVLIIALRFIDLSDFFSDNTIDQYGDYRKFSPTKTVSIISKDHLH